MKADRWARIETLFNDALEMPEQERAAFLNGACKGDLSILRDVESLIARTQGSGESFEEAIRKAAAEAAGGNPPPVALNAGHALGHYRVLEKLGAGGMGEVYPAEDTTLHRRVAVKYD